MVQLAHMVEVDSLLTKIQANNRWEQTHLNSMGNKPKEINIASNSMDSNNRCKVRDSISSLDKDNINNREREHSSTVNKHMAVVSNNKILINNSMGNKHKGTAVKEAMEVNNNKDMEVEGTAAKEAINHHHLME